MAGIWTQLQDVLKYDYLGPLRKQLNDKTLYLAQIQKTSKDATGLGLYVPLHITRNSGTGARGTTGTAVLPPAGAQGFSKWNVLTKDIYACILIYGKAIRATRNDRGAFLRQVRSEIEGAADDAKIDAERMLVSGDTTGTLTTCSAGATSADITVYNTQFLEEGMLVDVGGDTDNTIVSINSATEFTIGASITYISTDIVKKSGVTSGDELNGLAGNMLSDTATLMGLDVATYPFWKSKIVGTAGSPAALTEMQLINVLDLINKQGGDADFAITGYGGRRALYNLLKDDKRFTGEKAQLKAGFSGLSFQGGEKDIPITVNRYWPETAAETSFGVLTLKEFALGQQCDWEWMEEDGNVLARQTGSGKKEAYEGTLVKDCEHITYSRNRSGALVGVTPA